MEAQARFEALYREHGGAVRRYVGRRSEAQSADDVVADVFVVAWRRLSDMWGALAALSERDREVLLLVAWEELSPARAARVRGVSANTCAVRLYRARRRFARALAAESDHHDHRAQTIEVLR
jgi:RNA polymerase sigma-70 factor (ECF subfamily)